jgi:hypothetical protein
MLMAEGLALDPDVMTFYEGRSDSDRLHPLDFRGGSRDDEAGDVGPVRAAWKAVGGRLLVARFVDQALSSRARLSAERTIETLDSVAVQASEEFLFDLAEILRLARERGIPLIVANQQANSAFADEILGRTCPGVE